MTREKILEIVKVLGFRVYGEKGSYKLDFRGNIGIYLYHWNDKPQGWRISIYSPNSQDAVIVKKVEIVEDVLSAIYEYSYKMESLNKKEIFRGMLQSMNDKVRDLK